MIACAPTCWSRSNKMHVTRTMPSILGTNISLKNAIRSCSGLMRKPHPLPPLGRQECRPYVVERGVDYSGWLLFGRSGDDVGRLPPVDSRLNQQRIDPVAVVDSDLDQPLHECVIEQMR